MFVNECSTVLQKDKDKPITIPTAGLYDNEDEGEEVEEEELLVDEPEPIEEPEIEEVHIW